MTADAAENRDFRVGIDSAPEPGGMIRLPDAVADNARDPQPGLERVEAFQDRRGGRRQLRAVEDDHDGTIEQPGDRRRAAAHRVVGESVEKSHNTFDYGERRGRGG